MKVVLKKKHGSNVRKEVVILLFKEENSERKKTQQQRRQIIINNNNKLNIFKLFLVFQKLQKDGMGWTKTVKGMNDFGDKMIQV